MRKIFFVLLYIISHSCFGQNTITDSIHKQKMDSLVMLSGKLWDSDIDSSEVIARDMLKYSKKHKFLRGIGQAHGTLAVISSYKGNEGYSLWHSEQAIKVFEELGNEILANKIRLNLGVSFYEAEEYDEALVYTKKAYEYFQKKKDTSYLVSAYISLGLIKSNLKANFNETDTILVKAIEMSRSIADTLYLSNALCLRADLLIDNKVNILKANNELEESLRLMHVYEPSDQLLLGYNYYVLGKLLAHKKEFSKAIMYNDSAIQKYKIHKYMMGLKTSYENRVEIFSKIGDYKKVYETDKILDSYKDSLQEKRKKTQFNRLKIEYETNRVIAEKERVAAEAKLLKLKSKQNKDYLIGILILSFFLLMFILLYVGRLRSRKKTDTITAKLKEIALEKRNTESELKALKSQMNPHFIFNALNSIQEYIVFNEKELASSFLIKFSRLIRIYLEHSTENEIVLSKELDALNIYLELEKNRFEDVLDYSIQVSEAINTSKVKVPSLFIQPYAENALIHGLLHKKNDRILKINFNLNASKDTLICEIEDNGIGIEASKKLNESRRPMHKSFATSANEKRVTLLNVNRDKKIEVKTISLASEGKNGTKVVISIPV